MGLEDAYLHQCVMLKSSNLNACKMDISPVSLKSQQCPLWPYSSMNLCALDGIVSVSPSKPNLLTKLHTQGTKPMVASEVRPQWLIWLRIPCARRCPILPSSEAVVRQMGI